MPASSVRNSPEAVDAYTIIYSTLIHGLLRLYGAVVASSSLAVAHTLAYGPKASPEPEEWSTASVIRVIKEIDRESFDAFRYVERVSHLVYATALLDTFLLETTTFLFLLIPQAMGKSQQVPLKMLIDADSLNSALTQAAHTRAREISFKSFSDRLQFLREAFGLRVDLSNEAENLLAHYADIRNSAVHDQGVFMLSLDESWKIRFLQKTCSRHPTNLSQRDYHKAAKSYEQVCNAIARAVFQQILKCETNKIPENLLKQPDGKPPA